MGNIYTISQLAELISRTRPIVEKRLKDIWKKEGIEDVPYIYITENNKQVKAIELSLEQEHAIGIENISNTTIDTPSISHNEHSKALPDNNELMFKFIQLTETYNTRTESYMQRIIDSESKVLLLEDKSADREFYKLECLKFQQENVKLLLKIEQLEKEKEDITKQNEEKSALLQNQIDLLQSESQQLKQKSTWWKFTK